MVARLLALALLAILSAPPAAAQIRAVELYAPRAFGYVIGDTVKLTAEIALDAPFTLDPASLPQPRALNYWLELREARLTDNGVSDGVHHYQLDLDYQTFYAPLEPRRLDIPAVPLAAIDEGRRVTLTVPAWSFLTSPLREVISAAPGQAMMLRPDITPRPVATAPTLRALVAALAVALAMLILLAWQMAWWPFGRRRSRPFAQAVRAMAGALGRGTDTSESAYRGALLALHRAFDLTAGHGVFTEDLPAFFQRHPAFQRMESEVRGLFAASRALFFGGDTAGARRDLPPRDLLGLARRLRTVEREAA